MFSPFGNQTANTSAAWHPEPRGRGTFNVLSSCLTTMILCVWTAVHLNIPGQNEGTRQRVLRKLGWLLLALLAPEVVAWNAWEQRRVAQELTNGFKKAFEPGRPTPSAWLRRAWKALTLYFLPSHNFCADTGQDPLFNPHPRTRLVHGFYAAMGGYAIPSHVLRDYLPITDQERLTLTKHGVQWLLLHAREVFPDVTSAEILDKSKASTLVKTLTCLQAFWFCLQCIVRLTMNTSVSLLELNVFGHCTCTFIIYAIWWNKPLDVSEPTLLKVEDGPELEGLLAVLCSYTSRTVPSLPGPVAQCAVSGHSYSIWTDPLETGQTTNLPPEMPLWYAYKTLYQSQNGSYQRRIPAHDLETLFSANGAAIHSENFETRRGLDFDVDDNEERVDECAGLPVEQLQRPFNFDASLPQIKVSMYEDITRSKVRLTVGAEQTGLTYYLSRAKLEQMRLENEKSEQLEDMLLISGEPKKTSKGSYHLERSFLMWLDLEGRDFKFLKVYPWAKKSSHPFLDRIHDWTFRLNPEDSVKHHLRFLHLDDLANRVEDLFTDWVVERVPECFVISAAAFVYSGLHLLAWNAPFHAPIYGLLWKISGITITSLAIFPFLIMLFLLCNAYTLSLESKLHKYLGLTLAIFTLLGMLSFILLYIFARVYLVVENFLSLAYLPESVLVTPNFSLYFPHIG